MLSNIAVLVIAAFLHQVAGQIVVDTFDPAKPRPGATLPASIDPYGLSRPLPPNIDPFGFSYRPVVAGATLPAMYDPLGASRPGGMIYASDPYGFNRPTALGVPPYPGWPANGYLPAYQGGFHGADWFGYRPTATTNIGAPLIPDNSAATLVSTNSLSPPVVSPVPVPVPVPVNTVPVTSVPVNTVPVNTVPVNTVPVVSNPAPVPQTIPNLNTMNFPTNAAAVPGLTGISGAVPGANLPNFNAFGLNTGTVPMSGFGVPTGALTNGAAAGPSALLPPISK